jgi:hypothetical protein
MEQLPKDDILNRAIILKKQRDSFKAAEIERQRIRDEQFEKERIESDDRAAQFIALLTDNEIPMVDITFTDDADYHTNEIIQGWKVRDYREGDREGYGWQPALFILPDGRTFIGDHEGRGVKKFVKSSLQKAPFAGDKGLNFLASATVSMELV